jgi:hypothetical protein
MAIPQMLEAEMRPEQVPVEFDELNWPSRRARANFDRTHGQLIQFVLSRSTPNIARLSSTSFLIIKDGSYTFVHLIDRTHSSRVRRRRAI